MNAIQLVRLFAKLISEILSSHSELIPDDALTLTSKRYNQIQS